MLENKAPLDTAKVRLYSPLALAYVGDGAYELMVREKLLLQGNRPNGALHRAAKEFVCAEGQSEGVKRILSCLSDLELSFYKRGRNSDAIGGKNADIAQYKRATGVETLFGYLYLTGQTDRMRELFSCMFPDTADE